MARFFKFILIWSKNVVGNPDNKDEIGYFQQ